MTFTKIAVVGGAIVLALVCWLAVAGFGAAREGVICLVALVVLVGGGNLLSARSGAPRRRAVAPVEAHAADAGAAEAGAADARAAEVGPAGATEVGPAGATEVGPAGVSDERTR
jgi:hypothetical protein